MLFDWKCGSCERTFEGTVEGNPLTTECPFCQGSADRQLGGRPATKHPARGSEPRRNVGGFIPGHMELVGAVCHGEDEGGNHVHEYHVRAVAAHPKASA